MGARIYGIRVSNTWSLARMRVIRAPISLFRTPLRVMGPRICLLRARISGMAVRISVMRGPIPRLRMAIRETHVRLSHIGRPKRRAHVDFLLDRRGIRARRRSAHRREANQRHGRPGHAPDPVAVDWLDRQQAPLLWLTSITVLEIEFGIPLLPRGRRRERLEREFARTLSDDFGGRVLDFDTEAARAAMESSIGAISLGVASCWCASFRCSSE